MTTATARKSTSGRPVGVVGAVVAVAVPVLIFELCLFALYTYMVQEFDGFHIVLITATVTLVIAAVVLAWSGASLGLCLIIFTLSPAVVVVGYETIGHKHTARALGRTLSSTKSFPGSQ